MVFQELARFSDEVSSEGAAEALLIRAVEEFPEERSSVGQTVASAMLRTGATALRMQQSGEGAEVFGAALKTGTSPL